MRNGASGHALADADPDLFLAEGHSPAIRTLFGATTAPRSRGAVLIKIGLWLYDLYGARHRVMPRHALWSRAKACGKSRP
ncbi:MAG: hypothetical protein R3D46_14445 [Defluviimonas denitrificans]